MHLSKGTSETDVQRKLVCKVVQDTPYASLPVRVCLSAVRHTVCKPICESLSKATVSTQQRKYLQGTAPALGLYPAMFSMLSANKHALYL